MSRLANRLVCTAVSVIIAAHAVAAPRLIVTDSGAVERQLKKLFVVDSGGTARKIKKLYVIDSGGTARLVFRSSLLETTITIGDNGVDTYGYALSQYGSIASATYTDAGGNSRTVRAVIWNPTGNSLVVSMSGASVPDTDSTFSTITVNGVSFLRSARASYNGSAGGGTFTQWSYTGVTVSGLGVSGSVPLIIE